MKQIVTIFQKQYMQCMPFKQGPLHSGEEVSVDQKTISAMRAIETNPLAFRGGSVILSKNNICYACHSNKATCFQGRSCHWIKKTIYVMDVIQGEEVLGDQKPMYVMRVIQTKPPCFQGKKCWCIKNNMYSACHSNMAPCFQGKKCWCIKNNMYSACHSNKAPCFQGRRCQWRACGCWPWCWRSLTTCSSPTASSALPTSSVQSSSSAWCSSPARGRGSASSGCWRT